MQLQNDMWNDPGVKQVLDTSDCNPVCNSGHVLSHVVMAEFKDDIVPTCNVCEVPFEQGQHAFACYECVAAYYLTLLIASKIVNAELQKGIFFFPKCAYRLVVAQRVSPFRETLLL